MFSLTSGLFLINTLPFIFSKTRLVRELEKKFSGRHVVIVAQVCNVWLFLLHFIVWGFFLHPFGIQHFYDHWIKWQYSLCLWEMTVNHWAVFTTWFIWKLGGGLFSFFLVLLLLHYITLLTKAKINVAGYCCCCCLYRMKSNSYYRMFLN